MEKVDINNPNLDGDFKSLVKAQNAREKRQTVAPSPISLHMSPDAGSQLETVQLVKAGHTKTDQLREKLQTAAKQNNLDAMKRVTRELSEENLELTHISLRDPETQATALHLALEHGSWDVSLHLIHTAALDDYLTAEYEVKIANAISKKTALHFLADAGNIDLMMKLLDAVEDPKKKQEFLHKTTLMEVAGQRPRDFAATHIAALKGHTKILDYLVKLGVDVNLINKKDDTAALWAARGNNIDTMRRLIQLKADVDHKNDKGSTPLYWAVRYGFTDMVRLLAKEGAANIHHRRKLGLIAPVVMAAALGYPDIVSLLLSFGADVNTKITNDHTALHYAASDGLDDILKILLDHSADVDASDIKGSTPLHMAAKNGHLSTMVILFEHHASIESRDKLGKTIWNYAIEAEGTSVLDVVVNVYRARRRMVDRTLLLPVGEAPLHEAARLGDSDKVRYLLSQGSDPHATDVAGNTFVHIAARDNQPAILKALIDKVNINVANNDGDTAMQLAAGANHPEVVKVLIKKAKLNMVNKHGYTALHSACWSREVHAEVVATLVKSMVENNNWSLIDAKENKGNTALHVAALRNHTDVIAELKPLNPTLLNDAGDNPFHVAAKHGNSAALNVMFDIFNKSGKGMNLDQENEEGDTILHICAKVGSAELVECLIEAGADLAKRNKQGNSILHEMAEEIAINPDSAQQILWVFQEVVDRAPIWWCIEHDLARPEKGSDMFVEYQRKSLIYLVSNVHNLDGYDVLAYSAKLGALPLFQAILSEKYISLLSKGKTYSYDVTNIAPDTTIERMKRTKPGIFPKSSVGVISDADLNSNITPSMESYLDIIVDMTDEVLATQFLNVTPVKQLSENLWTAYQWIYIVLMIVHITYMSCLSAIAIPAAGVPYNTSSNVKHTDPATTFPYILFLTWPLMLLIFQSFVFISKARNYRRQVRRQERKGAVCTGCSFTQIPSLVINGVFANLAGLTAITFSVLMLLWYIYYTLEDSYQVYFLAVAMVIGWMLTIVFTKGFKNVQAFSTMLSYIIIRDVSRFVVIYVFVLLGFSMAMHALFQISAPVSLAFNSPLDTIFLTFNLMLGTGELFDADFDQNYVDAGSSSAWVKVVYLFYMILVTIIMLNLLIAMLSDTYNEIKLKEGTTWRVNSVRMALRIERWMPFLKRMAVKLSLVNIVTEFDDANQRWIMRIPAEKATSGGDQDLSEMAKGLRQMEIHMGAMQTAYDDIQDRMDEMIHMMQQSVVSSNKPLVTRKSRPTLKSRQSKMY